MEPLLTFTTPVTSHRKSLNQAIREQHVSQAMRRRLRTQGTFTINGQDASWDTPIQPDDTVQVYLQKESQIEAIPMPLSILREDDHLLIINKPAGLLMHPTALERQHTLANGVLHHLQLTSPSSSFHPIHRLDKDTSGLVIIAKNALVQHAFTKQRSPIQKVYDAVIEGIFPTTHASVHYPIARKPDSIIQRQASPSGQEAHTDVQLITTGHHHSHVRCYLHTGRTHQIRVHLSTLGYPLAGDDLYGGSLTWQQKQCLHATELHFIHPITGELLHVKAPLPAYFHQLP